MSVKYIILLVTSLVASFALVSCASHKNNLSPVVITSSEPKVVISELFASADVILGGSRPWDITVHNEDFYDRVLSEGSLGLGESYVEGWWDCAAIDQMIYRLLESDLDERLKPSLSLRWAILKAFLFNMQDKISSKEVIDAHYQLGNDLFEQMLDPLMMYSCGYWKRASTLSKAQENKLDLICKKLMLKPGMKVLDIGCGWGGFERFAAEHYGVSVVGVTLSENQAEYAKKFCQGYPVTIEVKDYRDIEGEFDAVVSIGMFEHVGKKNFREFMEVVDRVLKKDGLFLLHTIGRNTSTLVADPWIHKYIFPNGQLPSPVQAMEAIEGIFILEDWHNFGADYDKTLLSWHAKFNENWPKLAPMYDVKFHRMWNYYLLSCAGAFRSRAIQLWQLVLSREGVVGGYDSIR